MIERYNGFNPEQMDQIRQLFAKQCAVDNVAAKLHWHLLESQRKTASDYAYFEKGTIRGILSAYYFTENHIEITAVTDPEYREQGIFRNLLTQLIRDLNHTIDQTQLIFNFACAETAASFASMQAIGATHAHREYECAREVLHPIVLAPVPGIQVRLAKQTDLVAIAQIDSACFASARDLVKQRFAKLIQDPMRNIFVIERSGELIGKGHTRLSKNKIYIHDICIKPELQRQGFGRQLLAAMVNTVLDQGYSDMHLDVTAENTQALHLYEQCGFSVVTVTDFWQENCEKLKCSLKIQ